MQYTLKAIQVQACSVGSIRSELLYQAYLFPLYGCFDQIALPTNIVVAFSPNL